MAAKTNHSGSNGQKSWIGLSQFFRMCKSLVLIKSSSYSKFWNPSKYLKVISQTSRKLRLFRVIFRCFSAISGNFWKFSAIFCNFCPLLMFSGKFLEYNKKILKSISPSCIKFLAISACFWQYLSVFSNFQWFPVIFGKICF